MRIIEQTRLPNPRRVRMFLAEKGIAVPFEQIDLGVKEHRSDRVTALNPMQQVPILVLDDGTSIAESVAICRYFEELQPEPPLFGIGARQRAEVEMWNRRVELGFFLPVASAFRHLHPGMAGYEVPQVAAWGEASKGHAVAMLSRLDRELGARPFIAGDRYSIADITLLVAVDFMRAARIARPAGHAGLDRWYGVVSARPSAQA